MKRCCDDVVTPTNCTNSNPCVKEYDSRCIINEDALECLGLAEGATQAEVNEAVCEKLDELEETISECCASDPAWRVVGATGQPAFETGFADGSSYGAAPSFRLTADGKLAIRGRIFSSNAIFNPGSANIFTLPLGYRPNAAAFALATLESSGNTLVQIRILTTGVVQVFNTAIADNETINLPEFVISLD